MSPGRAEAHAEDARSALTRRSARSYSAPHRSQPPHPPLGRSRDSASVPSRPFVIALPFPAEPTGFRSTHTCFRRAQRGRRVDGAGQRRGVGRHGWERAYHCAAWRPVERDGSALGSPRRRAAGDAAGSEARTSRAWSTTSGAALGVPGSPDGGAAGGRPASHAPARSACR